MQPASTLQTWWAVKVLVCWSAWYKKCLETLHKSSTPLHFLYVYVDLHVVMYIMSKLFVLGFNPIILIVHGMHSSIRILYIKKNLRVQFNCNFSVISFCDWAQGKHFLLSNLSSFQQSRLLIVESLWEHIFWNYN